MARPTLKLVASLAGTSVSTVSKVLHGGSDVSATTRTAILRAIDEVGYVRGARRDTATPIVDSPPLVDIVLTTLDSSWANRALVGVEGAASASGASLVITIARPDGDWVARLMRRGARGAVIVGVGPTPAQLAGLRAAGTEVVLLDPVKAPPADIPSVGCSNWAGGYSVGRHLVDLGHTRVGIVEGGPGSLYNRARIDGFRSAMGDAGIRVPPERIVVGAWQRGRGREAALALLGRPDGERPTAVFALAESMALGVYDAAAELGLSIPGDVSVVGFDDLPEAQWAYPAMTTVQQPTAEMGAIAMRMLLDRIARRSSDEGEAQRIELSTRLVVRASTAPPRVAE